MESMNQSLNRRNFVTLAGSALATIALNTACRRGSANRPSDARITAGPRNRATSSAIANANNSPNSHSSTYSASVTIGKPVSLGLDRDRDAILYVPKTAGAPMPLLLFLHGATQSADEMGRYLDTAPDETGVAILAPNARDTTWDAITDNFGRDVEFLNRALARVFEMVDVDPALLAIGGFSDGATYAIALGLINGDLFKRVLGCSPGFLIDGPTQGNPRFFISHGTQDNILPIDRCGRRVANDLRSRGYEVTFREFQGRHEIPGDVMREGLKWLA